jgi:hypothetical protein
MSETIITFENLSKSYSVGHRADCQASPATLRWATQWGANFVICDEFQKCADIRMRYLGVATPTSTTVGVTRLAGPDFMI